MRNWEIRRCLWTGLVCVGLLVGMSGQAAAASAAAATGGERGPFAAGGFEELLGSLVGGGQEGAVYTDLGGGLYSMSMALSPEALDRLRQAFDAGELPEKAQAQSLTVISIGQAPGTPATPVAATHGVLSDTTYPYTYWIITLNLGSQTVTKSTTFKLTGPGLNFTRSFPVTYGAGGIWVYGYRPGVGVGSEGIYTFQGSVSGGGSITTKTFAVHP